MNVWKPIALCLAAGLVASIGIQTASRTNNADPHPTAHGAVLRPAEHGGARASLEDGEVGYLDRAEHNKGGWRVNALNATNDAIGETNKGCAVANK